MIRIRPIAATFVLGAVALSACSSSSTGSGGASSTPSSSPAVALWKPPAARTTTPMSDADKAKVDAAAAKALTDSEDKVPGFIVGIWDPQHGTYVQAYGLADRSGQKMTTDMAGYIGSITKTATATAVLEQVDSGKLTLEETIKDADPDLAARHPELAGVTIRRLLNMSSGIPDYANVPNGAIQDLWKDPKKAFTSDELIDIALKANKVTPPGNAEYSNTNYVILGQILAKATGKTAQEAVNAVFAQEGLKQTTISSDTISPLPSPASHGYYGAIEGKNAKDAGYSYGPDTDVSEWNRSWADTAGGAQSTIEEMAAWAASGLGTNLLSEKTAAERLHPASLGLFSLNEGLYGLGIGVRGDWIGHAGQLIGWESVARYNTKTGAVLVVLSNSSGGLSAGEQAAAVIMPDITQPWDGLNAAVATAENLPPGVPRPGASASASSS